MRFLNLIALLVVVVLVAIGLTMPAVKLFRFVFRFLTRVGRRKVLAVALVGLLGAAVSAGLAARNGMPQPAVHDEFSYLLAADTFAHGRLTNPAHPMWVHFETFHVIQQPTYASKYLPAQGLVLALGQVLTGQPAVGLWISMGLACAGLCWMLQAWLPPRWALLGGLLAAVQPEIQKAWGHSYWGGAVAMLGGVLVYGAVRRLVRQPRVGSALALAVGLAILANSRPYEGFVISLPAGFVLLFGRTGKDRPPLRTLLSRVVLPIVAVLAATVGAMSYYNFRVTGNPLRLAYQVHEATYAVVPLFLFQKLSPMPLYHHAVLHDFYNGLVRQIYQDLQGFGGFLSGSGQKFLDFWEFYLPVALTAPLVMWPFMRKERWTQLRAARLWPAVGSDASGNVLPRALRCPDDRTALFPDRASASVTSIVCAGVGSGWGVPWWRCC